jgi:lathosterol oxidase
MEAWDQNFQTQLFLNGARYLVFAGGAYLVFFVLFKERLTRFRIQQPGKAAPLNVWGELRYSVSTLLTFAAVGSGIAWLVQQGYTLIYRDLSAYGGWPYILFSLVASILIHDFYFYLTHRAMHHPKIFPWMHAVHHHSRNPSPWAAYSFHPTEAVVQAGILPLLVFTLPLHALTIALFLIYVMVLNVLGHLGHELFPSSWVHSKFTRWHNTSTHHNQHHQTFRYNFGLYFSWWDKWLGTLHPKYETTFDEVCAVREAQKKKATPMSGGTGSWAAGRS